MLLTLPTLFFLTSPILALLTHLLHPRHDRGSYTVSGLGWHKTVVQSVGGNALDLAIAMLETDTMTTDYTYGRPSHLP
jgi:hypothetical protein